MHLCIGVDYVTLLSAFLRVYVADLSEHCNRKGEGISEIFTL